MGQRRIRVAVIYGGRNSEHSISVVSAGAVMAALDPDRYEVIPVGITTSGSWVCPDSSAQSSDFPSGTDAADRRAGEAVVLPPDPENRG